MSVRITTRAWSVPLAKSPKLLLLALADNADDEGKCWPSVKLLAEKCTLSPRAVRALLVDLEQLGHIRIERRFRKDGSQTSNLYFILPSAPPANDPAPGGGISSLPGGNGAMGGTVPECRALNHHLNSSSESPPLKVPGGGESIEFKFPSSLTKPDQIEAAKRLQKLGQELGQQVLDELAGRGRRQPVKNPPRYLCTLIDRAASGSFTPDLASKVKDDRETRDRHLAAMQRREAELLANRPPVNLDKLPPRLQEILRKHVRTAAPASVTNDADPKED